MFKHCGLTISVLTRARSVVLVFEIARSGTTAATKARCYTLTVLYTCLRTCRQTLCPQGREVTSIVVSAARKSVNLVFRALERASIVLKTSERLWTRCRCTWRARGRSRFARHDYDTDDSIAKRVISIELFSPDVGRLTLLEQYSERSSYSSLDLCS